MSEGDPAGDTYVCARTGYIYGVPYTQGEIVGTDDWDTTLLLQALANGLITAATPDPQLAAGFKYYVPSLTGSDTGASWDVGSNGYRAGWYLEFGGLVYVNIDIYWDTTPFVRPSGVCRIDLPFQPNNSMHQTLSGIMYQVLLNGSVNMNATGVMNPGNTRISKVQLGPYTNSSLTPLSDTYPSGGIHTGSYLTLQGTYVPQYVGAV